ncbi:MAG: hypothetical protein Fur0010_01280 [Bdellovibrio sp.]
MGIYFLGIKISESDKKKLKIQSWPAISYLKDANLVPTYNWHYSLAFIGKLDQIQVDTLKLRLIENKWPARFKLGMKGFGGFPALEECRVLYVGVQRGEEVLTSLAKQLRKLMDNIGIEYDQKPFVPHLTLLRLNSPRNLLELKDNGKMKQEIVTDVHQFTLYYSQQDKSLYQEVLQIDLP